MSKKELNQWYHLLFLNAQKAPLEREEKRELIRLNHLVMEEAHKIHNDNMLDKSW